MNPKNKNPKTNTKQEEKERSKIEHDLYLKKKGEKKNIPQKSTENSAIECTGSKKNAEKSWRRRSLE